MAAITITSGRMLATRSRSKSADPAAIIVQTQRSVAEMVAVTMGWSGAKATAIVPVAYPAKITKNRAHPKVAMTTIVNAPNRSSANHPLAEVIATAIATAIAQTISEPAVVFSS